jgi:hypothetical protein
VRLHPVFREEVAEARAALGEDAYCAGFNAGQALPLDQAVEYALK